ncbi:ferric reductase like transmembrane component-domain-containing protein [Aspergillus pseudonomiae]|uniref:Ferric reductase like transmembrane component-domain-containing protein n=1 Tax=Aspergillus pseudonomiae TaxID=1506151 RepID=A0A5N7D1E1_9EURO|nr:ferric reductase like transmembrane component-domain-containing protein [Aspergillus pseudonomiae]KAB8256537.1 ferric reductase like transmembrane component-domain-containing protein [Aspergillus pseudonomiae]KAE8400194.1 ferric reductase like transmembrane component-domain-containing protein [Aspergillus pseudonomiae]
MHPRAAFLALCWAGVPVLAGQGESHNAADTFDEYCFYSIYTALSEYTFAGSTILASSQGSGGTSHGGSNTSGGGQASSSMGQTSSRNQSSSSAQSSAESEHSHSKRYLLRRGHKGSSGTSTGPCNSTVEVTSMYASAKAWCSKAELKATIPYWQSLCEQNSLTLMDLSEVEANVTDTYLASLPTLDPEMNSTSMTGTIESPVLLSHAYYKRAHKSYVTHDFALDKDKRFGWGLMGYWGGILVLGMMAKLMGSLSSQRRVPSHQDAESSVTSQNMRRKQNKPKAVASMLHSLRTSFVVPASFAPILSHHQQLYYWHTVPRRLDLLIVLGFWALCIILGCVDYQSFSGNIEMSSVFQQNWQYSSDRTGILSYACLPFLWLFAGRNNIFLWATNFSVQSFNIFHRHVAWACTIFAIIHSVNYSVVFAYYDGRFQSVWVQEYWYMGVVATILMSFMLVQSMTILRRIGYETFLIIHIAFAIVVVYALFRHTSFDGTKWNGYLWPMVAIWGFDRTVRLVRIAYCNLNVRFGKQFVSTSQSTVHYCEASDLIKVEVYPASTTLTPRAGQHYYLYQPVSLKGWENHPFTLGAYVLTQDKNSEQGNKLIFYIRPYDGWTRRLRDLCRKSQVDIRLSLLLEGPYGSTAALHTCESILMIVGGTGIAAAVPYIIEHVSRAKEGTTRTVRIQLVWSARSTEMYSQVFCDELSTLLHHEDIATTYFCTNKASLDLEMKAGSGDEPGESPMSSTLDDKEGNVASSVRNGTVRFLSGRPDVGGIIKAEVQEAKISSGRLAVLTCGPAQMADDCRQTVYEVMKDGFQDIEYHEEAFGW